MHESEKDSPEQHSRITQIESDTFEYPGGYVLLQAAKKNLAQVNTE